ncbi:MAG: HAMP domain-containing sensor histidine kinase [Nitriliruptoraceae bacterium]
MIAKHGSATTWEGLAVLFERVIDAWRRAGAGLVARTRLALCTLGVVNLLGGALGALIVPIDRMATSSVVAGAVVLSALLIADMMRARATPWIVVVEALVLAAYMPLTGMIEIGWAPYYALLLCRSMAGTVGGILTRSMVYFASFAWSSAYAMNLDRPSLIAYLIVHLLAFVAVSQLTFHLFRTLSDHEANARSVEATLAAMREVEEMKNTFLTATSHELRTPVSVIHGIADVLANRWDDVGPDQRRQLLDRLNANTQRLWKLLEELLDVDRLLQGRLMISRTQVDVTSVVVAAVDATVVDARPVTKPADSVTGWVDRMMVERIVENLVANAVKYTPAGTPIDVQVRRDGHGVTITVDDEGPGVPLDQREAVFDVFRRLDGTHPSPGTGIGLALVKRFAQLHGGSAFIADAPNGGCRVVVVLPDDEGCRDGPDDLEHPLGRVDGRPISSTGASA